jgi:hypothetical protein
MKLAIFYDQLWLANYVTHEESVNAGLNLIIIIIKTQQIRKVQFLNISHFKKQIIKPSTVRRLIAQTQGIYGWSSLTVPIVLKVVSVAFKDLNLSVNGMGL